jgi:hypothetical protein
MHHQLIPNGLFSQHFSIFLAVLTPRLTHRLVGTVLPVRSRLYFNVLHVY